MSEKTLKTRIQLKHDLESHWDLATGFVPKEGELIIYDSYDVYKVATRYAANDYVLYSGNFYKITATIEAASNTGWSVVSKIAIDESDLPKVKWKIGDGQRLLSAFEFLEMGGGVNEWIGTKAQYDAIPTKDPECTYYITDTDSQGITAYKVSQSLIFGEKSYDGSEQVAIKAADIIYSGTTEPPADLGEEGDIYIQYEE